MTGERIGRVLRRLGRMLTTAGIMYVYAYYIPEPTGPGPTHPERLCPDVPLSPTEQALADQLRGPFR